MIGVVGGGQLAKLLVAAGKQRAVNVVVQTTSKSDPAAVVASEVVLSDPTNVEGTKLLAKKCRSITFENEWVDISSLMTLQNEGVSFFDWIEKHYDPTIIESKFKTSRFANYFVKWIDKHKIIVQTIN